MKKPTELAHSLENDFGMNPNDWPKYDSRLKELQEWFIKHPDDKKRNLSDGDIQEIQKLLDAQTPKKDICKIFGISQGSLAYDIKIGILDDVKWKAIFTK